MSQERSIQSSMEDKKVPPGEPGFDAVEAVKLASEDLEQVKESLRALKDSSTVRQDDLRMQFSV
jgi:hypothetical protein